MSGAGAIRPPLSSFVGRAGAVATVRELLGRHRRVTLTGAGGCGKTRLAVEIAAGLQHEFAGNVAFVDLAPLGSPALVAGVLAAATGVHDAGGAPLLDVLAGALAERPLLVLADNCERVAAACGALFGHLLERCPRLVVLATSRRSLGHRREVTWRVPSLTLPAADGSDLEISEAGRLLLDRAALASPGFTLVDAERPAAALVCRRLDGIPLAIELAAGRLRALDVDELARGLDDRFRLLARGSRAAPPRQRTLEASIAWSHDLLTSEERVLFRRLGVFAAGFTPGDVSAVCRDAELAPASVPRVLEGLADACLLQVEASSYRMFESVRAFARLRLAASGEEERLRHRHLDHLLAVTAEFNREADGPGLDCAGDRAEPLIDDFRGALDWALRRGRIADGLRLAADLRLFWVAQSRNQEGQRWLGALIAADARAAGDDGSAGAGDRAAADARAAEDDVRARTRARLAAGELCFYARDPQGQAAWAAEALADARRVGDRPLEAWALVLAGWADVYAAPDRARRALSAGREAAQAAGDPQLVEFASYGLGTVEVTTGRFDAGRAALATGIAIARTSRQLDLQYGLGLLGYADVLQGRLASAGALLHEATASLGGGFDRVHLDMTATWLAVAQLHRGEYVEARVRLDDAIASARAGGSPGTFALLHLGLLERALGHHQAARDTLAPILEPVDAFGPWFAVQARVSLADAALATGDRRAAASHCRAAVGRAERSGHRLARVVAALGMARLAAADGDLDRAQALRRGALRTAAASGFRLGAIDALDALAAANGDRALRTAVDGERARSGYVRFPVDGPSHRPIGQESARGRALGFHEAVALALRTEPRPERPVWGWESLTPAEARVATLVARGLTNPEIGERLLISPRTVQAHLSHVYGKVGVDSRVEVVAAIAGGSLARAATRDA